MNGSTRMSNTTRSPGLLPLTRDELKAVAVDALQRLKKCPGIVRGFFADPKLAYIHA